VSEQDQSGCDDDQIGMAVTSATRQERCGCNECRSTKREEDRCGNNEHRNEKNHTEATSVSVDKANNKTIKAQECSAKDECQCEQSHQLEQQEKH